MRQRMASSNASHIHQNNPRHDWMRYVFGLRTFQGFVIRKVEVEENYEKCVDDCGHTISNSQMDF